MVTKNTDGRPYHVLLVEGNVGDVELTIVVLTESKFQSTIDVVGDGDLAMAYVRRTGEYANAPRPDIILLDFNLPTMDGFEVLTELSADNDLGRIPVMILTGNEVEDSVLDSFGIPASRFSRKPPRMRASNVSRNLMPMARRRRPAHRDRASGSPQHGRCG